MTASAPVATLEEEEGVATTHLLSRSLIIGAVLLAVASIGTDAAAARALSPNDQMRQSIMALRGVIDRRGAMKYFQFPQPAALREHHWTSFWPRDPWTGRPMRMGTAHGQFTYTITPDRRHYQLVGYLDGDTVIVDGGIPGSAMRAYDHRSEEGINLIRQYVEDYAGDHDGLYPAPAEVCADGVVGSQPVRRYWPSNPWDHQVMAQRPGPGSFSYQVTPDRRSYTLRLHRSLKNDYVLTGAAAPTPWQQLLGSLEDEIIRRNGKILAGYVDQWALQHAGAPPAVVELARGAAVGAAHADWPRDPTSGDIMRPGPGLGAYSYAPGAGGAYVLTVHLHSGEFQAGGTAPSPAAPALSTGISEP